MCTTFIYLTGGCFVSDVSGIAYDALKMAVEHVLGKIKEGKRLSTEDVLILYLGTIAGDLREIKADIARLDHRIDETNRRIDEVVKMLSARIDDLAKLLSARIDETNKRIDALQITLLEIQKLLIELVRRTGSA
jgi:uncharacterized coiled-coil DUF342 family protein